MLQCDDTTEEFQPQIRLNFTENEMGDAPKATRRLSTNSSRLEAIDKRYLSQSSVAFYGRHSVDSRSDKSWLQAPPQVSRLSLPPMVERNQDGTHGKKFMSASYAGPDLRGHDFRYSRRRYLRHISSENSKRVVSFLRKRLQDRDRLWLEDDSHAETERPETDQKSLVAEMRVKSVNLFSQYNEIGGRVSKEGHINGDPYLLPARPLHNELSELKKPRTGGSVDTQKTNTSSGQKGKGHRDVVDDLLKYVVDDIDDSIDGTECEARSERGPDDIQIDLLSVRDAKSSAAGSDASKSSRHSSSKSNKSHRTDPGKGSELTEFPLREGKSDSGIDRFNDSSALPKVEAASNVPTRRASLPGKALSPTDKGEFKLPSISQQSERQISKSDEVLVPSIDGKETTERGKDSEKWEEDGRENGLNEKGDEFSASTDGVTALETKDHSCEVDNNAILPSIGTENMEGSVTLPSQSDDKFEESKVIAELPDLISERTYLVSPVLTPLPDETSRLLDDHWGADSTVMHDLLEGDIHIHVPIEQNIIRLYISSHLSDMESERTILMSKVFPKGLRQFCKEWGYELQVIDPHWGLKDAWTNDHSHVDLCLELLEHCKTKSRGPYFMMMSAYLKVEGLLLQRSRVRASLQRVDPPSVAKRWSKVVKRRTYKVPNPNSLWHMDGHMKLVRWKLVTHGCIDGYSRCIVYLQCGRDNSTLSVLRLFAQATVEYGLPSRTRSDHGGENYYVALFMELVQGRNRGSHITGESKHNERIERLWRDVFLHVISYFYDLFYHLEDEDLLNIDDPLDVEALHRVYLPEINRRLHFFHKAWNRHAVRTEQHQTPRQIWVSGMLDKSTKHTAVDYVFTDRDVELDFEQALNHYGLAANALGEMDALADTPMGQHVLQTAVSISSERIYELAVESFTVTSDTKERFKLLREWLHEEAEQGAS